MYGVLGEGPSDAETIKAIVARVAGPQATIHRRYFGGKDKLLSKGSREIALLVELGCTRFVVCHDADGDDPSINHAKVMARVVKPAKVEDRCCVVVPVQMIEAWILADIKAASRVIKSWRPGTVSNPESFRDPKRELERMSRALNRKPRYDYKTHNVQVARHLDLAVVERECPSFRPLAEFLKRP